MSQADGITLARSKGSVASVNNDLCAREGHAFYPDPTYEIPKKGTAQEIPHLCANKGCGKTKSLTVSGLKLEEYRVKQRLPKEKPLPPLNEMKKRFSEPGNHV